MNITDDAIPKEGFDLPPYKAELFSEKTGWSGVINKNGVNCLTFKSKKGATITDFETASLIASEWNKK